jgi:glucokinase
MVPDSPAQAKQLKPPAASTNPLCVTLPWADLHQAAHAFPRLSAGSNESRCPGQVTMTNHPWSFSIDALRRRLGLNRLRVINDFAANALSIPDLDKTDAVQVGSGSPSADAPIGIIGPGTGLGVSALLPHGTHSMPLPSEGGHVTMPAADARETAVLELMRLRFDHVSAERVLSGPGLVNLYNALCDIAKVPAVPFTPAQITDPRIGEEDPQARGATSMFCAMLGTIAGNLALTLGARGGIYIEDRTEAGPGIRAVRVSYSL